MKSLLEKKTKKSTRVIASVFIVCTVFLVVFYSEKNKVTRQNDVVNDSSSRTESAVETIPRSSQDSLEIATDIRFQPTLDLAQFRYPMKKLPVEFSGCEGDFESPIEDPYKFTEGLGLSRVDFLPDAGDLQSLFIYLKLTTPRLATAKNQDARSESNEANQAGDEGSISENSKSDDKSQRTLDQARPFIKLALTQEIEQVGKFRLRALTYSKENLKGPPEELELHPDTLVLLHKKEALMLLKNEVLRLMKEGATVGSRSVIISQEYQMGGPTGLLTVEFYNGDIARLNALGINCSNMVSTMSCQCLPPKEIP